MTCREVLDFLADYLNGELSDEARAAFELHLLRCPPCVNFLNTYDGDKPFCLIVALVNPHDVQEFPGRGVRGLSLHPTYVRGGYRYEDFCDLPIDLPANVQDDLATKQIARDMVAMVGKIDDDLLKNIKNLRSTNPQVSCSTCHRGQTKPETKLPDPKPGS